MPSDSKVLATRMEICDNVLVVVIIEVHAKHGKIRMLLTKHTTNLLGLEFFFHWGVYIISVKEYVTFIIF